jgi:hypothetical protein
MPLTSRNNIANMLPSFIVIFCHIIQSTDSTDLPSLQNFVSSLESCRMLTEGADKLYKMCHLFLQVAKLYLQAKTHDTPQTQALSPSQTDYYTTDKGQFDLNSMTEFDSYLSALGLMPNSAWPMANFSTSQASESFNAYSQGQGVAGAAGLDMSGMGLPDGGQNSLQDWFSGSRYLMNMMEASDDTQMPDLNF